MKVIIFLSVLELYSELVGLCMIFMCLSVFRLVKLWLVLENELMLKLVGMVMLLVCMCMWLLFRLWMWMLLRLKCVVLWFIDRFGL